MAGGPARLWPSPGFASWLAGTGGSLAFSTYQSERIFLLGLDTDGRPLGVERVVGAAMGLAVERDGLWVANRGQIWRFANIGPARVGGVDHDAVYSPRFGTITGPCDIHDILAGVRLGERQFELLFANTLFNCVATIDRNANFVPVWKPSFISGLSPEDRCHLNGLCERGGRLTYVTCCAPSDEPGGWRREGSAHGLLLDVASGETVAGGLCMPHSPRWRDDRVWMVNSGLGEFGFVIPETGRFEPICTCPGFPRGLTLVGGFAIIGLSTLRQSDALRRLPLAERLNARGLAPRCGLLVVDLATGAVAHWLTITGAVSELYDVAFIPGIRTPFTAGFSAALEDQARMLIPASTGFPLQPPRSKGAERPVQSRHEGLEP